MRAQKLLISASTETPVSGTGAWSRVNRPLLLVSCSIFGIIFSVRAARTVEATPVGEGFEFGRARQPVVRRQVQLDAWRQFDAPPERPRLLDDGLVHQGRRRAPRLLPELVADFLERPA